MYAPEMSSSVDLSLATAYANRSATLLAIAETLQVSAASARRRLCSAVKRDIVRAISAGYPDTLVCKLYLRYIRCLILEYETPVLCAQPIDEVCMQATTKAMLCHVSALYAQALAIAKRLPTSSEQTAWIRRIRQSREVWLRDDGYMSLASFEALPSSVPAQLLAAPDRPVVSIHRPTVISDAIRLDKCVSLGRHIRAKRTLTPGTTILEVSAWAWVTSVEAIGLVCDGCLRALDIDFIP
jgi:hypothetical protein